MSRSARPGLPAPSRLDGSFRHRRGKKLYAGGDAFLGDPPLGQGKVNTRAILAMIDGKPMDGMVIVELDSSPNMPLPPIETAKIARAYLLKQGVALRS